MHTITVYGASDDLIEIDGAISEEFQYRDTKGGELLAFSDGTLLRIEYTRAGVWRIAPVARGTADLHIDQVPEDNDTSDGYTDRATLTGDVRWCAQAVDFAAA